MNHLKHINEMDNWATPNRLGGDFDSYNIEQFIKEYPVVINHGQIGVDKYFEEVIKLAVRLNLSSDDLDEILKKDEKDVMLLDYLSRAFTRYKSKYLD